MADGQSILSLDREHHNRISSQYDDWYVQPLQYQLLHGELADELARAFSPADGLLVEFGAGTGALAIPLSGQGYDILAVDTSEGMLARLCEKCPNLRTLQGDASEPLPIDDHSAGCVLISQALHHIPNQQGVIEQAARILKPGGKLCIFEPQLLPKLLDFLRRIARSCCCPGDHLESEEPINPAGLRRLVQSCGFKIVRCHTCFFLPFNPKLRLLRWLIRVFWRVPGRIPLIRRLGGVFMLTAERI